jgi:hypothetical protein
MKEIMSGMDSSDVRDVRAYRIDALIELLLDISQETNNLSQNAGLWVHAQRFFDEAQECDEVLDTLK